MLANIEPDRVVGAHINTDPTVFIIVAAERYGKFVDMSLAISYQ
jgi:hypothetical protein